MDGSRVALTGMSSEWVLVLGEEQAVAGLYDCAVEVRGPQLGKRVFVRDWRVIDTPFGSAGYVGRVVEYGAQVALEDRNTASLLVLTPETGEALRDSVGHTVLVVGPVVGMSQVQVVAFRVLD